MKILGIDPGTKNCGYAILEKSKFKTKNGTTPYNKSERQNLYTRLDYDFMDKHSLTLDYTYNKSKHISGGTGQYHPLFG